MAQVYKSINGVIVCFTCRECGALIGTEICLVKLILLIISVAQYLNLWMTMESSLFHSMKDTNQCWADWRVLRFRISS